MSKKYGGLGDLCDVINETLSDDTVDVYMKLYVLMYADDTVVLAETADELQKALNGMN